ncbi:MULTISPECIES: L,D-transpeptidase family protein [unclassified Nocardiopsis]|uniref:L,D-transpeptidase family protein n=1 Tax=unclassified Nocardiopsis TaxID=2649073 RepID=UPI001359A0C1|nr:MULTISPECIES: L,D-transpeptidase family protein [unclassified Nocardiopsis]
MATPRVLPVRQLTVALAVALVSVFALVAAPVAHAAPAASIGAGPELRQGSTGPEVSAVQERLTELGYWIDGVDGQFGFHTEQAVVALQKAAGIARDGVVGPDTRAALAEGVRPGARTSSGDLVEIDLDRQLLLVVSGGEVERIVNTSTGSGQPYEASDGTERIATTPTGTYTVFREVDSWDPGPYGALYRPKYFNRGIAVHGYPSVPPEPASKGCARVSLAAMDWLWESGSLDVHTTVLVR